MTIPQAVADIDRLTGDLEATGYLLADAEEQIQALRQQVFTLTRERDEIRRRANQLSGEVNRLRAELSWRGAP